MTTDDLPCTHRGQLLRTVACELCGERGKEVPIYTCAKHGQCALRRWKTGNREEMATCLTCGDRTDAGAAAPEKLIPEKLIPEKLILEARLSPGDVLTMTAAIESLHATYPGRYLTDVRTSAAEIWEHNPRITPIADGEGRLIHLDYPTIHSCNERATVFLEGYCDDLGRKLGVPLRLTTNRPHLYLSDDERKWTNQVRDVWAADVADRDVPFWLVSAGVKSDYTAKQWPIEHFQEVIDATRGRIQWVQAGAKEHDHPSLSGVLDLRGKTDGRQLIRLAYWARGGLGPVTYLQHLMAAWEKPYLCLVGGRESVPWVSSYPFQHTFHSVGTLDCCRVKSCWKSRVIPRRDGDGKDGSLCVHPVLGGVRPVARCMALIRPAEVLAVLDRYSS